MYEGDELIASISSQDIADAILIQECLEYAIEDIIELFSLGDILTPMSPEIMFVFIIIYGLLYKLILLKIK